MNPPSRPNAGIIAGSPSHRLIRGVLRVDATSLYIERIELLHRPEWSLSIVDTGDGDQLTPSGDTTFHILWERDEDSATIDVDGTEYLIAPGDTMSVPGETVIRRSPGMLLVQIESSNRSLEEVMPPNHGEESFDGYNRRTDYDSPAAFALERWKITQPLSIPPSDSPYAIVGLIDPLALVWPGGTDLIGRGECRLIEPGTGPVTLLPDGLGYALLVRSVS
jgi:hypothetical protein